MFVFVVEFLFVEVFDIKLVNVIFKYFCVCIFIISDFYVFLL